MRLFSDQAGGTRRIDPQRDGRATTLSAGGGRRGMALILVLTTVAVLTAVVVEFAYDTRIDTTLAVNSRDALRAHYLARSAANLSRLVLHFQFQIDTQMRQLGSALGGAAGGAAGGGGQAGAQGAPRPALPRIQVWKLLPVESATINTFIGAISGPPSEEPPPGPSEPEPGRLVPAAGLRSFGSFEGGFSASIEDEETKFNPNRLTVPGAGEKIFPLQLYLLMRDPRWDFLFDEENANGERFRREELIVHMRDYVDANETGAAIDRLTWQLADGVSDEEGPYTRYRPRYRPKNALLDTPGELYQIAGIDDRFMAAFGDRFTVFTDINAPINVNTDDPLQLYANILIAAKNPDDPALQNPAVIESLLEQIELMKLYGGVLGMTVQQFAAVIQAAGIEVRPEVAYASTNSPLGDTSQTFRIQAIGQAGEVAKKITTVVRYDEKLGKLLYWRED